MTSGLAPSTPTLMRRRPANAMPVRSHRRSSSIPAVTLVLCACGLGAQQPAPTVSLVARATSSASAGPAVTFANGQITVRAENASLNQLIRDIARVTGMKISGSVTEDRVFGTYGPADPQVVLATLLEGTGTNLLILSNTADTPVQLVLTRRQGAATPPNPNAAAAAAQSQGNDDDDTAPPASGNPPVARRGYSQAAPPQPAPQGNAGQAAGQTSFSTDPAATQPSSTTQQVVFPPVDATSVPATATTTPTNPDNQTDPGTNAVKTPQQIFDQLQRLRQQNTQAPPQ